MFLGQINDSAFALLVVEDESQVDGATRQLMRIGPDRVKGWIPLDEALSVS